MNVYGEVTFPRGGMNNIIWGCQYSWAGPPSGEALGVPGADPNDLDTQDSSTHFFSPLGHYLKAKPDHGLRILVVNWQESSYSEREKAM